MKLKTILSTLALASVVLLAGCSDDDNNDISLSSSLSPTVTLSDPANNATDVALNTTVTATFSKKMTPSTINASTFTLMQGENEVVGTVSYTGTTATFKPAQSLAQNTPYTATITTGARDLKGGRLNENYTFGFTTVEVLDTALPLIVSTYPNNNEINVTQNKLIAVDFSEPMNTSTINNSTFTLKKGTTAVEGTIAYSGTTATFTPTDAMAPGTVYTALLTNGAKDLAGNALATNKEWSFTTEEGPAVISVSPLNGDVNVMRNALISASFNKEMDASTINALTFTLKIGTTDVQGTVSYTGTTAKFTPKNTLLAGTQYTATITTSAKDLAGNALAAPKVWSFTTVVASANQAVVNLKSSINYVILAKTAISTVPASAITGDMGLSPAATSYITGFSLTDWTGYATSTQVTGKVYAADMADPTPINLTTAVEDMMAAYTDAAGRPTPDFLNLGTGNIGGKTLTPGLYNWGSTVTVPTDVTISGGADDVWIFQISGDLSVSANVKVTLEGGAQAKNIFWQVAGEATFGATSHFEGIILSQTGITFRTGASFNGRALAQSAVILDANTIVNP
ncbi:ice-binding family protein [Lutibacter sp.]|uniref:ice-binding family protein n=1 Tax=Lutibacter sp. TaxID=1925666 RepID=UPI00356259C4